jgi:hypothetical protein|tara:strand:+ start:430 stop:1053 length:624 start_codon:yes stop_codon:yes gene_type:complete
MGEKLELTIPTDWKDITIGIYQDYVELQEKKLPEDEFIVAVVCVLCNVEKETLERIRYKDLKDISNNLMKLLKKQVKEEKELIKKVDFKGKKYGFIPNLSSITLGEYVDIETSCKDSYKNLHKIMSILYRPIVKEKGTRYSIEEYAPSEYKEDEFKDFPLMVSMSALSFFFRLGKKLPHILLNYSVEEKKKEVQMLQQLVKSGGGTI